MNSNKAAGTNGFMFLNRIYDQQGSLKGKCNNKETDTYNQKAAVGISGTHNKKGWIGKFNTYRDMLKSKGRIRK